MPTWQPHRPAPASRVCYKDVRSARTLGGDLADFTASRSSIDRSLQRITDVISKAALEKLNPLLEAMATTLEVISENSVGIEVAFKTAIDGLGQSILGSIPWEVIKAGAEAAQQQAKDVHQQNKRGDLFALFQEIPDLGIDDAAQTSAYQTQPVHFDQLGGSQLP